MRRFHLRYKLLAITVIVLFMWGVAADVPFSFKAGDVISADQMNQNFAALNNGKQELIKGTCAAGSSIRIIAADGSVTCEVDDIGSGAGDAGVDAINGMTGAVTLQAGDNITIDDSQQGQIKISSTGGGGSYSADNTSLELTGTTFSIKDAGVTASKIALPLVLSSAANDTATFSATNSGTFDTIGVLGRSGAAFVEVADFSAGVLGDSKAGYGVVGASENSAGVAGFGTTGVSASAISDTNPDLELGGANGIITGDGLLLQASGSVTLRLDQDNNSTNTLGIRNGADTLVFSVAESGDAIMAGTLTQGSDRNIKHAIETINSRDILEKVAALPISSWRYDLSPDAKHVGPMAQDFYAAFGLGSTDKGIATVDGDGISLAAIQGLYQLVQEQSRMMELQEERIADLEHQLAKLD